LVDDAESWLVITRCACGKATVQRVLGEPRRRVELFACLLDGRMPLGPGGLAPRDNPAHIESKCPRCGDAFDAEVIADDGRKVLFTIDGRGTPEPVDPDAPTPIVAAPTGRLKN
jgi:hypothetical protein